MVSPVRALILDFGEVLTRSQPRGIVERMAATAGIPLDDFVSRYWRHRQAYDSGLTGSAYWSRVLDGHPSVTPDLVSALIDLDVQSWTDYREGVWEIAAQFRARGGRTAMLSNGVVEIVGHLRTHRRLERWFDVEIVSCEVGRCKPDPEIYRLCVDRLGVPADETVFVDDRPENLSGAEAVGLRTFHFAGDSSIPALRAVLGL